MRESLMEQPKSADPMGTGHGLGNLRATISGSATMTQHPHITASNGLNYDCTLILAVEISNRSWVAAAQVPGLRQKGVKQQLAPRADALMAASEGYKRRGAAAGMAVDRVIMDPGKDSIQKFTQKARRCRAPPCMGRWRAARLRVCTKLLGIRPP